MTKSDGDFGETLRSALQAATEVEPADDALERIRARARVRTPRRRLAAILAVIVPWRVYRLLQYRTVVSDLLRNWTAAVRTRVGHARQRFSDFSGADGPDKPESQPRHADTAPPSSGIGWLRPALAAAAVAFVATLAVTVGPVRQAIVQLGSSVMSSGHGQSNSGSGTLNGNGSRVNVVPASTRAASASAHGKSAAVTPVSSPTPCASSSTRSSAHGTVKASSCATPAASASATTEPQTSPSASVSPSPTSTATTSPAPSPSPSATPSATDTSESVTTPISGSPSSS